MATGISGYLPKYYHYNAYYESKYGGMNIVPHFVEEYNVEGNYSVIKIDYIELTSTMYSQSVKWDVSYDININGTTYNANGTAYTSNYTATKWATSIVSNPIYHNTDGSKTITISLTGAYTASGQVGAVWGATYGTLSTKTVALTTIPRASKIAVSSVNVGETATITLTKFSSNFTHTLTYAFGNNITGTIATKNSGTSFTLPITDNFYNEMTDRKTNTLSVSCITYSGDTVIGETIGSATITAAVDVCRPTLAPVVKDISPETLFLTNNENVLVRYYSDVEINIGAEARNAATLKAVNAACGGKSIGSMTGTINDVETGLFTFSATDSRDYTTTEAITKQLVEYIELTCNMEVLTPTTEGNTTITVKGNYFNGTFGNKEDGAKDNTLIVLARYKANDEDYIEDWLSGSVLIDGNTYTATIEVSGLNYRNAYTFQARAIDMLKTIDSATYRVKTIPVFDWSEEDFNFNVPVNVNGGLSINGKSVITQDDLLNALYPIGALYITLSETTPAQLFGGTWTRRTDRFLLGGGNAYTVGNTGGSSTHTLTINEIPSHRHTYYPRVDWTEGSGNVYASYSTDRFKIDGNTRYTAYTGGGAAHNNMPPYLVVNIWQRTA